MLPDAHVSLRGLLPGPRVASGTTTEGGVTVQERGERGERAERREQTAQRIVEAAGIVIDRKGYTAASIPEIQDVAQVSRGGFYHHFASKQELGDAVLARQAAFFERVSKQTESGPAPTLWLQALTDISHQYTASILNDPVLRAAVRLSIEPGPYQTAESYAAPSGPSPPSSNSRGTPESSRTTSLRRKPPGRWSAATAECNSSPWPSPSGRPCTSRSPACGPSSCPASPAPPSSPGCAWTRRTPDHPPPEGSARMVERRHGDLKSRCPQGACQFKSGSGRYAGTARPR